jgi:NitT/TauT family transport system substrate-binding protein
MRLAIPFRSGLKIAALAFVIQGLSALVCFGQTKPDLVRLGNLKFAHYGAVSYMKELGPKYDLEIKEQIFPKGIDIIPAILSGNIDISASALDAAIAGRAQGAQIYVVAGFSKGGVRIIGRIDLGIKAVSELKGRKVGVPRGGAQELCLFAELAKNGLSWSDQPGKDVQIFYLAYADLNQALQQKQIDAICQSEPQSTQAISAGFGTEIVKPYDSPIGEPVRALVMTEKLYKEKPDVAARVLECFVAATKKFIDEPATAETYVCTSLFKNSLSAKDYKDTMENAEFTYEITLDHVQKTTDLMKLYGVGRLTVTPKAEDWVKLDLLTQAKQKLGIK